MHSIKPINVIDVCQPGANIDVFKPLNKNEIKDKFGIPHEIKFVGTVMRNQPRKLFTRIIESFRMFKREFPKESSNVKLLLHTSIPDVGWNIPEVVYQCNLQNEVVFSYICHACGNVAVLTFMGSPAQCPTCKQPKFCTPNTMLGFSDEYLSWIYNLMEVYIQGSIAEGDGMPVTEAKSCGVPCVVSDYSALYEKARNGGGIPIKSDTLYTESETMQWRDLFNRRDLARILGELMGNDVKRKRLSIEARECVEKYYSWDLTAKKWEAYLLNAPIKDRNKTYNSPIELKKPVQHGPPKELNDADFIKWCYLNILCRKGVDDDGLRYWLSALAQGMTRIDLEKHFRSIIDDENNKKKMLIDSNELETNPMKKIENIIRAKEGSL
jgi:glycosyltransferase involved in cell wall biosynthesis